MLSLFVLSMLPEVCAPEFKLDVSQTYNFVKMAYQYNYHTSGHYPSSFL
jgi:hypothetical protein